MGTALIKIKLMPESPDSDLDKIESDTREVLKKLRPEAEPKFEREPIAFGLNAIIANFTWDEADSIDNAEEALRNLEQVNSAEVIDFRRALG